MVQPKPRTIRVRTESGEDLVPTGESSWVDIAATVDSLNPKLLQALDAEGKVLRAIKFEALADRSDQEDEDEPGPMPIAGNMSVLERWGQLLSDAYRHQGSALEKMVDVLSVQGRTIEAYERLTAHLTKQLARAVADSEPEQREPDLMTGMMQQMVAGALTGANELKPPNGKGTA